VAGIKRQEDLESEGFSNFITATNTLRGNNLMPQHPKLETVAWS
jgi:hypothetical protein